MDCVFEWMDEDFVFVSPNSSVAEARYCLGREEVEQVMLIDLMGDLHGVVDILDIADADPDAPVHRYCRSADLQIGPLDPIERAVALLTSHSLRSIPVTVDGYVIGLLCDSHISSLKETLAGCELCGSERSQHSDRECESCQTIDQWELAPTQVYLV